MSGGGRLDATARCPQGASSTHWSNQPPAWRRQYPPPPPIQKAWRGRNCPVTRPREDRLEGWGYANLPARGTISPRHRYIAGTWWERIA